MNKSWTHHRVTKQYRRLLAVSAAVTATSACLHLDTDWWFAPRPDLIFHWTMAARNNQMN